MEPKKLISNEDQKFIENEILKLLIDKKCTLSDFDGVAEKVHQFYSDNATVEQLLATYL